MSQFTALSQVDGEVSVDLGTLRPLSRQDEQDLKALCSQLSSGQEDAAKNAQPRTPSKNPDDPRGCRGSDTAGACRRLFSPETPEECLDMMKLMGDTFAKTVAAQANAEEEVNALKEKVENHEKRIAVLEGHLKGIWRIDEASRKRRAEEATGQGSNKRPAAVAS